MVLRRTLLNLLTIRESYRRRGKALSKVQTVLVDGTIQAAGDATPGTYSFRAKLPNRYYTEMRTGGNTWIDAYNGKSAWHQGESGQIATFLGPQRWSWKRRRSITTRAC